MFIYLDEVEEGQTRDDLAMITEEVIKQRMLGVKNSKGVYITPAFPKIVYVLDEDNIHEDSKYYYLTELAARCTAKRMVPDYVSAKIAKKLKKGNVYGPMGCVEGSEIVNIKINDNDPITYSFEKFWDEVSGFLPVQPQNGEEGNPNVFIDTRGKGIYISDMIENDYVEVLGVIRNVSNDWLSVTLSNGTTIKCTSDHPFHTVNEGTKAAKDLVLGKDLVYVKVKDGVETARITKIVKLDFEGYSYDVTTASEHFDVSGMYSHNCRSFLTVEDNIRNEDGSHKFYGRFNQGVVTINLVDVACSSGKDMDKFWEILEERLELCHRALRCRHDRLVGTVSDVAPILWQFGAYARLKKGEKIDPLLYNGYSTISLGYAGIYEMCYYMLGVSHSTPTGKEFALSVMQKLNDKCAEWKAAEHISYSVYGTPIESTVYKFAKALRRRFGVIEGVTDKNYITNSYH